MSIELHQNIVSGGLAALGGSLDVLIEPDGHITFRWHVHNSGLDSYNFNLLAVVRGSDGTAIASRFTGDVGGTFGTDSRDEDREEKIYHPMLARHFDRFAHATLDLRTDYESSIGSTFEDIGAFVFKAAAGAAVVTPGLGLVLFVGTELGSLAATGSLVPGARLISGVMWLAGPAGTLYALAGEGIAQLGSRERELSDDEYRKACDKVFGDSLPPKDRIRITDSLGGDDRPFTFPRVDGKITLNMGPAMFDAPLNNLPLFLHELTHAWQIGHTKVDLAYVAEGLAARVCELTGDPYEVGGSLAPSFKDYSLEQQGKIVETWARSDFSLSHPYFRYIDEIRRGLPVDPNQHYIPRAYRPSSNGAVSRHDGTMETWRIGPDGSVQDSFWYEGQPWKNFKLAPSNSASFEGGLTAVSRFPTTMELWWIGNDASIQGAFWYEGSNWSRYQLSAPGSASTSGGIASLSRKYTTMELWWITPKGAVRGAFWYEGAKWAEHELAPAESAATTSAITAVSRHPGTMELWWIAPNGSVQGLFWYEGAQWTRYEIAGPKSASPTGGITSLSRAPNTLELWWVRPDGAIEAAYWHEGGKWTRYQASEPGAAATTARISGLARKSNTMELLWVGPHGSIEGAFWYEGGSWTRQQLAAADSAALKSAITSVARVPHGMEFFWTAPNGSQQGLYWYEGGSWTRYENAPAV